MNILSGPSTDPCDRDYDESGKTSNEWLPKATCDIWFVRYDSTI